MSNHARFLISMLFIAVILLCVVLTRFYFDVTKNTESYARENRVASIVRSFGNMQVFESMNGLCGILDASSAVVIEPEWTEILDITSDMVLVSGRLDGTMLIGGIDYEENVVLPFVFRSMEKLGDGYHVGVVDADGRRILYDRHYQPVFRESFESVSYYNKLLETESDGCRFSYDMSGDVPALRSAELACQVRTAENLTLRWKIANQVYLSDLSAADLRSINHHAQAYMQMLEQNDFRRLSEISNSEYFNNLEKPGILAEYRFENISRFSFSRRESGAYDFAFRLSYHIDAIPEAEPVSGRADVHFYFRRNAENQMILTAADFRFENASSVTEE